MKKVSAFFFFIFTVASASAQFTVNIYHTEDMPGKTKDMIFYRTANPLGWDDFKGVPDRTDNTAALTTSGFGYKMDMKGSDGVGVINVGVYCYFSKKSSWVKPGMNTAYILTHEQHHFDATYLACELFISRIKSAGITVKNFNTLLPKIYKECCDIMNDLQNKYDTETSNGRIREVQEKWNAFFDEKVALQAKYSQQGPGSLTGASLR